MGILDNIIKDKSDVKNELTSVPDIIPVYKRFTNSVNPKRHSIQLYEKNIAGAMIWGSSEFGVWGSDSWGDSGGSAFILNSSNFGVLGTNQLGGSTILQSLYAVLPHNNIYNDYLLNELYLSSSSTVTLVDNTYSMSGLDVLESEVIAKLRRPINKVLFQQHQELKDSSTTGMILGSLGLGESVFSDNTCMLEYSLDGSTWRGADIGVEYINPSPSDDDELRYRITANGVVEITQPIIILIN